MAARPGEARTQSGKETFMPRWLGPVLAALALILVPAVLPVAARGSGVVVVFLQGRDGLSGTWRVSRVCLAGCVAPPPALRVVHHVRGDVYMTDQPTPQVLYRLGKQVLVHGVADSSVLAIQTPGQLMSGSGVGANGSTFTVTWRCVAPPSSPTPVAPAAAIPAGGAAAPPARPGAAMEAC
jgi:hypothetical protein